MNKLDFKTVADAALAAADNLLAEWLPGGKYKGPEFFALNPTRADRHLGSFAVNTHSGAWADYATDDKGGDLISLYAYLFTGGNQGEAFRAVSDRLNLGGFQPVERVEWDGSPKVGGKSKRDNWTPIFPIDETKLKLLSGSSSFRWSSNNRKATRRAVYRDAAGLPLMVVQRFEDDAGGKEDKPFSWCKNTAGEQEWRNRRITDPQPLYGLDGLARRPNAPVLLVEGEKCKDVAAEYDALGIYVVMSWLGGCNGWKKADWQPLAGREVLCWPDCDSQRQKLSKAEQADGVFPEMKPYLPYTEQPGMEAMLGIAQCLSEMGCTVSVVEVPKPGVWPAGYDVADVIMDNDPITTVGQMLAAAKPWGEFVEVSPAPTDNGVPAGAEAVDDETGEATPQEGGAGGVIPFDKNLKDLLSGFALIEGKVKALEIRSAVEWTKAGLEAKFGKQAVEKWLESPRKATYTQGEVNIAKQKQKLFEAETAQAGMPMMERYVYLDGSANIWDAELKRILDQKSVKMRLGDMYKMWENSPDRRVVRFENVVFEPGKELSDAYINLFEGLPMADKVELARPIAEMPNNWREVCKLYPETFPIQKLIWHLCNNDMQAVEYTLNWLAYPLQHVGAKMATALVFHGDVHGAGKSLFFEDIIKPLYGDYAATLGQSDLESQYTGNRSGKLFVLFEEIFNNRQKYDHSGAMKHMITGKTMRIEKKFIDSYEQANYINCVFLSNEVQPFKIEENDRRYFVVWPNETTPEALKREVLECIGNGGLEKFYSLLLSLPLLTSYERDFSDPDIAGGKPVKLAEPVRFDSHSKPPMTAAKQNVIALGRYSWQSFYAEWMAGEVDSLPYGCCVATDLYQAYTVWCRKTGETAISSSKFTHNVATRMTYNRAYWRWPESNRPAEKTQSRIFKPKGMVVPDGVADMDHIGRQVGKFKAELHKYLGVAAD